MALRLQDLCKTTRRAAGSGLPRLFPRILGDDRLDARLGIAIRFFETHLGRSRGELDAEALTTLFGDPRLARGLLRCLAHSYRYRTRPLAEVLGTERAAALAARGQGTPRDLRALAYRRANEAGGFVSPAQRADFLRHLVDDLEPTEIERALWLDAPDQAMLVRHGPVPTAADMRACYNVQVLETLLSTAPESHFTLRGNPEYVEAVATRHAVQASVKGTTVTLYGRPDVVGVWTRHGVRMARTALILLTSRALGPGVASVHLGEQQYEVRLDTTLLDKTLPLHCWAAPASTWEAVDAVVHAVQTLRQRGRLAGWRLR
jgi:predicted nuclease of restriction endonuclease-like RecB superfamily